MLERIEAIIRSEASPPPVAKLIGIDLISVEPGKALVELQATQVHANPNDRPYNETFTYDAMNHWHAIQLAPS